LNVTTPIDGTTSDPSPYLGTRSNRRRISATIAFASIGFVRSSRPAPDRWNVPGTRTSDTPRPSGSEEGRPCVGAGNDESRLP
jgi:hypothetical protein